MVLIEYFFGILINSLLEVSNRKRTNPIALWFILSCRMTWHHQCDQIIEWDDPGFSFANLVLVVIFTILLSVYENYVLWFSVNLGCGNLYLTSIAKGFSCFVQIKIGSAVWIYDLVNIIKTQGSN